MGFDTLHPLQYARAGELDTLVRDRFVYEEQNEIKTWYHKRRKRIAAIENDLSYEFRGQFVVTRARAPRPVKPAVVTNRYKVKMVRNANSHLVCCPVDFDGVYRTEDGSFEQQIYPMPVECLWIKTKSSRAINIDHVQFIKNLEDPELVPRERKSDEAGETNNKEEASISQTEKKRRQKKLNKQKATAKEAESNETLPIVFKGLHSGNKYDIHGEVISAVHKFSDVNFKSAFSPDSRNTKERYVNEVQPVVDMIERGVADFQFYHPLPGEPRRDNTGMGIAEPALQTPVAQSTTQRLSYLREWDRQLAGLERISTSTELPTIVRDPPRVTQLIDTLPFKTRQFLNKNSDQRTDVTVLHREHKDNRLRSRVSLAISAIVLKTIMDPMPDMEVLASAFPLLLRAPGTSIRDVWTIGLELLTWRRTQGEYTGMQRTKDEDFLEWLFINYQSAKVMKATHSTNRDRMSGPEFFPHLIIQKLRFDNPKSALERIDESLLESRFSDNPVIHFFRGVAYCQLIKQRQREMGAAAAATSSEISKLVETARMSFDTARAKGGVFPQNILDFELRHLTKVPEADAGASTNSDAEEASTTSDDSSNEEDKETNKKKVPKDSDLVIHHIYTPFSLRTTHY